MSQVTLHWILPEPPCDNSTDQHQIHKGITPCLMNNMGNAPGKAQRSYAWSACTSFLRPNASHMTAVFGLRRSQASFAMLPVEVWSSMSTQAALTLDDKCALRSASASLRRLVNSTVTKVRPALSGAALPEHRPGQHPLLFSTRLFMPLTCLKAMSLQAKLDLADKSQRTFPPGLRPYVQHVYVRATASKQLRAIGDRLSGVPSAAALELELSFGRNGVLNLDTVRSCFSCAGLTERVRAMKYCCKSVSGTKVFPGRETPVFAELWPAFQSSQPAAFWRSIFTHSLVELHITLPDPEQALRSLKGALRGGHRICGTLRCLQVDSTDRSRPSLRMHVFADFWTGLKMPCLEHLGCELGVVHQFVPVQGWQWPQTENLPTLQSFGGTRKPDSIFGLGGSGVHLSLISVNDAQADMAAVADMAALADSALGHAISEVHATAKDFDAPWEGIPAAMPFTSVHGFLTLLGSLQLLDVKGWVQRQLLVRAEAINALSGLQKLALKDVTLEGDLTGPCLTEIICSSLQTQLLTVLARPPPALASILVPHKLNAVVPFAVLGVDIPWATAVVRACPGAPCWKVSHETYGAQGDRRGRGLVRAVPCRG